MVELENLGRANETGGDARATSLKAARCGRDPNIAPVLARALVGKLPQCRLRGTTADGRNIPLGLAPQTRHRGGLDRADYGTHSMRRTKATLILSVDSPVCY